MPRTLGLIATLLALAALPATASATTWRWSAPLTLPGQPRLLQPSQPAGVACPSTSLCVAFDANDHLYTARAARRGATAWRRSAIITGYVDGAPDPAYVQALSCASPRLCLATTELHGIYATSDPRAGDSDWRPAGGNVSPAPAAIVDPLSLATAIDCPSARLCVATTERAGGIAALTTTDPAARRVRWVATPIGPRCAQSGALSCLTNPHDLACPTTRLCVAVNGSGAVISSADPTAHRWKSTVIESGPGLTTISCATAHLCVAGDGFDGQLFVSAHPAGGRAAWRRTSPGLQINWFSCPLVSLCVANQGDAFPYATDDVAAGARTWRPAKIDPAGVLEGISCPTATFCVAIDDRDQVVTGSRR